MRGHRLGSFKRWKGIFQGVRIGKPTELSHSVIGGLSLTFVLE